jgi:hypothetical protein
MWVHPRILAICWICSRGDTPNYLFLLASPRELALLRKINALEVRWDTSSFAVSYTFPERVSHQRGRTIMDYQLDRHIIESWRRHEHAEPHFDRAADGHGARRYRRPLTARSNRWSGPACTVMSEGKVAILNVGGGIDPLTRNQPGRRFESCCTLAVRFRRAPKAVLASAPCRSDRPHERRRR